MCAVFVSILINSSYSQSANNFKTYTNNDLNFTIQHPSNWKPEQSDLDGYGPSEGVYFGIRKNPEDKIEFGNLGLSITPSSYFRIDVEKIEPQFDYNTMTLQNKSLQQYVQGTINVMSQNSQTLIRQGYTPVAGYFLGIKTEFTHNYKNKYYYGFNILTISDGKLYTLSYEEKPLKVPETLPLVNKMVDSFKVNTEDEDTSNNSTFEGTSNNSTFEDYQNKYCTPLSLVLCPEEPEDLPRPPPQD
jgi:hypothetical protein